MPQGKPTFNSAFEEQLWFSSVPLVRLNDEFIPNGHASGTLIEYHGKRILLTAEHATGDQLAWSIALKFVPGRGERVLRLGPMNFLASLSVLDPKAALEEIDFAYVEVPDDTLAYRQVIDERTDKVTFEAAITVHKPGFTDLPDPNANYGFCGLVLPTRESHFGRTYVGQEFRVYQGLKFLRTEGDMHYFKLPFPHPGHEQFHGCSGAPGHRVLGNRVEYRSSAALRCGA